jgi:hypothetical protein
MITVVLAITRHQAGNWLLERLNLLGKPHTSDPDRWSVEVADDWLAVAKADYVREDYEPDELESLARRVSDPAFYVLEAHTENIAARYIKTLPEDLELLIDNDHGWIAPVSDYKEAMAEGLDWLHAKRRNGRVAT